MKCGEGLEGQPSNPPVACDRESGRYTAGIPGRTEARMTGFRRPFRTAAIVVAVAVLAVLAWITVAPAGGKLKMIDIPPGASVHETAIMLRNAGIVRSALVFEALARLTRRPLLAGEYGFARAPMFWVLRTIQGGRVYLHRILVAEGLSVEQVVPLLAAKHLVVPARFRRACSNRELLASAGIDAPRAEGYLFPDTYLIPRGMGEEKIVALMLRRFVDRVPKDLNTRAAKHGLSPRALVALASIVEKEARVPDERPLISAVFHNRLKRGMPLQADPTVLYALSRWDSRLSHADLKVDSPYNTYRYKGLPPGPICSPGLASLKAAADPADAPWLYFVTRKDGTFRHNFSRTLGAHEKAERISRDRRRELLKDGK